MVCDGTEMFRWKKLGNFLIYLGYFIQHVPMLAWQRAVQKEGRIGLSINLLAGYNTAKVCLFGRGNHRKCPALIVLTEKFM
jgi:hypothetical protein